MTDMPSPDRDSRPGNFLNAGHYENFPVASIVLPHRLRAPIRTIYAFARAADDIADEGDAPPDLRLAGLEDFRARLAALERGEPTADPIFAPLGRAVRAHRLSWRHFHDLLDAFAQDVVKTRYAHFGEVMDYCRRSANPVGRLLLELYGDTDPRHQAWSDGICAALQLINFLQDVAVDYRKGRIYLPLDELERFAIPEAQIAEGRVDALWQQFMKTQTERARRMLVAGSPLGRALKGRVGLEMRLIILGGARILDKIEASRGDVFRYRPRLLWSDWPGLLRRALFPGAVGRPAAGCSGNADKGRGGCSR